ncbi:MAG: hypothetical protein F2690_02345 [Actinobacteria bacterium]|uniref:Unannotated protein n=1 Tax=freshwater metagenome TaxID=449393 RepID=A0A6J6ZSN4_9ZZZZ|nr:hypothetical protein [Actinomycetota bacterium]MSX71962.1 hypothetical protein [Actinomycetota bacterium]MSY69391.1 hypothetical protein [Actinomycetota bacterium]MTA75953.1 hypothetical protein [Actinomycetota bacterium]
MELQEIRNRWNEVLDAVLEIDRISWLSFFDARLAEFDGKTLTLDFSDARKLSNSHEFSEVRIKQNQILIQAISKILAINVTIAEQ